MIRLPQYYITATVACDAVAWLAQKAVNNKQFCHRNYSLWHAEVLETLAGMIRDGYADEADSERAE